MEQQQQPLLLQIEIGIDEAGRGPVLGPLVYGCTWWPADCADEMKERYKFKDSKQTTVEEREEMYRQLKQMQMEGFGTAVSISQPEEVSNEMLDVNGLNLNQLSYNSSAKLLRSVLEKGFRVKRILLDQLGPPAKHISEMRRQCGSLLSPDTEILSESKADDRYPVVSAASIIAKVTRDELLEKWDYVEMKGGLKEIDHNFGCGYPSDPLVKKWLLD